MKELEEKIQYHNQKLRACIVAKEQVLEKLEELTQSLARSDSSLVEIAKEESKMRDCQQACVLLSKGIEFHAKEAYRLSKELAAPPQQKEA